EQIGSGVQCMEWCINSSAIAHIGKTQSILQGSDESLLLFTTIPHSLVRDQPIGAFSKRRLNLFLLVCERSFFLRLREFDIRTKPAGCKDRLRYLRRQIPRGVRFVEQTRQLSALASQES